MNLTERDHLLAEQRFLSGVLQEIPEDEIIDRMSTEARLRVVEDKLRGLPPVPARARPQAIVTFRGRPVLGSEGIVAEFGAEAVDKFAKAIAALAASFEAPLRQHGPIRNRSSHQLVITDIAQGSFGFQLEALPSAAEPDHQEPLPVEKALSLAQAVLEASLQSDDEALAETASEVDSRALGMIRAFLKAVSDADAAFSIRIAEKELRYDSIEDVELSVNRLSEDNIHEEEKIVNGVLLGITPYSRVFDYRSEQHERVITGKISTDLAQLEELSTHTPFRTQIKVLETRVGHGRPRFKLLEVLNLPDQLRARPTDG